MNHPSLPEPYQPTQPMPGWPTMDERPLAGPVELYGERQSVVWVPDAYGRLVPMPKDQAPPPVLATPARDLSPEPLLDRRAQMMVGGGVLAAGTGWGLGQVLSAVAAVGASALMWLAIAIVAAKMAPALSRGQTTVTNINKTVVTHNRWWGRSTTHM